MGCRWLQIAAVLGVLAGAGTAHGSPWALPKGKLVLGAKLMYQFAEDEFLDTRSAQPFPLNGSFQSTVLELQSRVGLAEGIDFEMQLPVRSVSYASDPVILLPTTDASLDTFQENVINLARDRAGFADLRLGLRYQFLARPFAMAFQTLFEVPLGYEGPSGTFGDQPDTQEEFLENAAEFVRPGNVEDDVTLGDGVLNVHFRLHVGWAARFGLFVRGMGGYNIRLDGAGDEVEGEFRMGQVFGRRWLVYAGSDFAVATEQGRRVGISVAAIDPTLPATQYGGTFNLNLRELRLERDFATVSGGVIYRISSDLEVNVSYDRILWGRNVSAVNTLGLTVAGRVQIF